MGAYAWKVSSELPAHEALGPNGEAVAAQIERCKTLTADEPRRLVVARGAAWGAAWGAARCAARRAAWDAAGIRPGVRPGVRPGMRPGVRPGVRPGMRPGAAWGVARNAALALVVCDLITAEQFNTLSARGPL